MCLAVLSGLLNLMRGAGGAQPQERWNHPNQKQPQPHSPPSTNPSSHRELLRRDRNRRRQQEWPGSAHVRIDLPRSDERTRKSAWGAWRPRMAALPPDEPRLQEQRQAPGASPPLHGFRLGRQSGPKTASWGPCPAKKFLSKPRANRIQHRTLFFGEKSELYACRLAGADPVKRFRLGFRCSASHSMKGREEKGWEYLVGARHRRRDQRKPQHLA